MIFISFVLYGCLPSHFITFSKYFLGENDGLVHNRQVKTPNTYYSNHLRRFLLTWIVWLWIWIRRQAYTGDVHSRHLLQTTLAKRRGRWTFLEKAGRCLVIAGPGTCKSFNHADICLKDSKLVLKESLLRAQEESVTMQSKSSKRLGKHGSPDWAQTRNTQKRGRALKWNVETFPEHTRMELQKPKLR